MKINELIRRNLPVLVIGALTVLIFLFIIFTSQRRPPTTEPELIEVDQQELIAPHTYVKGPSDAPVTIVEFTDFGCPACKTFHPMVKTLYEEYPGQIRWAFRHFPIASHKDADQAAIAAQAAGEQDKFWEFADVLFENQNQFQEGDFLRYADFLGMDLEQFRQDFHSSIMENLIISDLSFTNQIGLNSTPTFFINGKQVIPSGLEEFRSLIEEQLVISNVDVEAVKQEAVPPEAVSGEPTAEEIPEQGVLSFVQQNIENRFGVLEISFTEEGFSPRNTQGYAGQKVIWTNNSGEDFTFVQLMPKFDELKNPFVVKAGETFEFTFSVREGGLWTYKNEGSTTRASIFINKLPKDLETLLPAE